MKPADYPEQPSHLWEHFYSISQTPRPSGCEAALRGRICALADEHDFAWRSDQRGNLVVYVPARGGLDKREPVVIQNHLDMVTVKTDGKVHEFASDPLQLQVSEGWLSADRTTLGADNGVGCAAAMALMTDATLVHPPLELLFTVEEETGLFGAAALDAGMLSGTRMLNLDTEDWGELFVGCSGGRGWVLRRRLARCEVRAGYVARRLSLRSLSGGHSGLQIHQQTGNAIKLLGQWLAEARQLPVQLTAFDGGIAHNVIPPEATLDFFCPQAQLEALENLNSLMLARWKSYLPAGDQSLELKLLPPGEPLAAPLIDADQELLLQLLLMFPHGAQSYSLSQPADLVDLSINLALVRVDDEGLYLETTLRFFNEQEAQGLVQQVLAFAQWLQCEVEQTVDYPGWQPDFESPLLAQTQKLYSELFGEAPQVKAIHAGLECGILKSKLPAVDIISFGPTIRGAHSPSERLDINTIVPFWTLLTTLLARL